MRAKSELALACDSDLSIATDNAIFGQPEIKIGVIPGDGGIQRLPRIVGLGRAKEWKDEKDFLRDPAVNPVIA